MAQPHEKMVTDSRFTAVIKISQSVTVATANGRGYFDDPAVRKSGDLLEMTLTADSLASLKGKLHAHIDLTDELD